MTPAATTRARLAGLAAAAVLLRVSAAHAQADDPAALFAEAVTLLQSARHLEALGVLERVRAQRETPTVFYNMAVAQRALGRPVDAIASLERYLALAAGRIDDARRAEVGARIAELRAALATVALSVRSDAPDLRLTLDGDDLPRPRWTDPRALNPGRHVWRLTGAGLRPLEVVRDVAPGARLEVDLRPEPVDVVTRLAVRAPVAGAEVVLDGVLVGTDGYDARVVPGRHAVEVRARGHLPYRGALDIAPGASVTVRATLEPDVALTQRWWFWAGVSVLAAGAVAAVAVAAASGVAEPSCGTTGYCFR